MAELFFVGEGRLGNQIFQCAALRKFFPAASVTSPTLHEFFRVFVCDDWLRPVQYPKLATAFLKRGLRTASPLIARCSRFIGQMTESRSGDGQDELLLTGAERRVVLSHTLYAQNFDVLQPSDFVRLPVRPEILEAGQQRLLKSVGGPRPPITVHVRRADYLNHTSHGIQSITLPAEYYRQAISRFLAEGAPTDRRPAVLFVTDDEKWCEEEFGRDFDVCFSRGSALEDFAILATSANLVCSNSTFSLAAALCGAPAAVKIPKYWFGWSVSRWAPPNIGIIHPKYEHVEF